MLDRLITREILPADAAAAAALSGELGYPVSPEVMRQRIEALTTEKGRAVFVACLSGQVVGWIDISVTRHLQSEVRAEIGGFVVSSKTRSCGVGRILVGRAETWAREQGLKTMVVRSQIMREAAHRFYLREGYQRTKTSAVFTKEIGD